jgi:hypothetical protein
MYKIIGTDSREYGPVSAEQVRRWIAEGRVNNQTLMKPDGSGNWQPAGEIPEFAGAFPTGVGPGGASAPPVFSGSDYAGTRETTMATVSLVLGILSLTCFGVLAGLPAVVFGHVAQNRARRNPSQYGGAGLAIAGYVLGYCGILLTILVGVSFFPAIHTAKDRAESIQCVNQMKQIGLAFRVWAADNKDRYPFNVSTNEGGTYELVAHGTNGFDLNAPFHFRAVSNELNTPAILTCPSDHSRQPNYSFNYLSARDVTYQLRSGTNVDETHPREVLAICPIHGHVLYSDGHVEMGKKK